MRSRTRSFGVVIIALGVHWYSGVAGAMSAAEIKPRQVSNDLTTSLSERVRITAQFERDQDETGSLEIVVVYKNTGNRTVVVNNPEAALMLLITDESGYPVQVEYQPPAFTLDVVRNTTAMQALQEEIEVRRGYVIKPLGNTVASKDHHIQLAPNQSLAYKVEVARAALGRRPAHGVKIDGITGEYTVRVGGYLLPDSEVGGPVSFQSEPFVVNYGGK